MIARHLMGAITALTIAAPGMCPALAQDAYLIGVSGALTGPAAGTTAPPVEGLRIYFDRVNAAGGINGKQVKLIILDDSAEPSKAAANAKRLLTQDNIQLMILSSFSSTFAPVSAEAKRANVPLLYMGSVCPKEVSPPADPNQFCSTAYILGYDSRAALDFIKARAKEPVRIGFAAMAVPLSRAEIEYAEVHSKALGMTPVGRENIPPPTPDYTPFATKLQEANPNWIYSYAPWLTQVRTLEAMRRLGWKGEYIAWAHIEAEADLVRLKDPNFYVIGANSFFQDGLPLHQEITEVAKKSNAQYPPEQMTEGWIGGLVIEAALKSAGWPATADKIRTAMEGVKVDTKGLRGTPLEWTPANHERTQQSYRVYRWDPDKKAIVRAMDWKTYEVK
jgi:ABC-type branched-subunit amino acid transport system substrate-binding protein